MKSSVSCILQVIGTLGALGQVYVQSALAAVFSGGGAGGIPACQQTHLQPAHKSPPHSQNCPHSQKFPFKQIPDSFTKITNKKLFDKSRQKVFNCFGS